MSALGRVMSGLKAASGGPSLSEDGTYAVAPWWSWMPFGERTKSGVDIGQSSALGLVSVYACVRVLAESVASLPFVLYRRLPNGGTERAVDHELYSVLHDQPNPDMTSFVWRETVMTHLTTWGNSYNEIAFDEFGRMQLWPIPPNRVEVKFEAGKRVYYYLRTDGTRQALKPGTVFHIPGLSSNGLVGLSPIQLHREALGLYQALQDFGSSTMRNMARPATVLSHPKTLSKPAIDRLAVQMDEMRGSGNAGKTVVLEEGLTVSPVGIPPDDAQYIESRKFQRTEVAAMFRVPLHKIGDLERATFSNIEHQSIEFVQDTLRPWLVRIEQECKAQLFYDDDMYAEFLIDGLLRGDAKSRAEALAIRWQHGTLTPDEWRALENENPLPDDVGKVTYTPVNYAPVLAPAEESAEVIEPAEDVAPILSLVKSGGVRCSNCGKMWAKRAAPPFEFECVRCKTINQSEAVRSADEPDALLGLRSALRALAEPPVVNVPAPVVTVAPTTVRVDTESFADALDDLRIGLEGAVQEMAKPKVRKLIRDDAGRLVAVES